MRIEILHASTYRYDGRMAHAVQALRLTPPPGTSQKIISWRIEAPGIETATHYIDGYGNRVDLAASRLATDTVRVVAAGIVETSDTGGVVGRTTEAVAAGVFLRQTPATSASPAMEALATSIRRDTDLSSMHALMEAVHDKVAYDVTATHSTTTAAQAFAAQRGVCQDHAHILIGAARTLGIPARYVTGYLVLEEGDAELAGAVHDPEAAHHAWAEALIPDLGWVGFDAANCLCPTERYVRLTSGLDAASAAPIRGVRRGVGKESLTVEVSVQEV
jgi:transglutaminase-like putative cysteine protease